MHRVLAWIAVAGLLMPVVSAGQIAKQGSWLGQWKLNVAKSDFGPDQKPQGKLIVVGKLSPDAMAYTATTTSGNGMMFSFKYAGAMDGKDHAADGIASTFAYSSEAGVLGETEKDSDGTVYKGTLAFTPNGRVATWTYIVTDAQGVAAHSKWVYDRVK